MERQPFLTHCFVLIICKHNKSGKYLCVKETRNRGWWVAGGLVEPGEDFITAAYRETKEETGIEIDLKGILRIEHSVYGHQTARMRVIFYATSDCDVPKQISDSESECAAWYNIEEIKNLEKIKPGLRGAEIIDWPIYIEKGGLISPLSFLQKEGESILKNQTLVKTDTESHCKNSLLKSYIIAINLSDYKFLSKLFDNGFDPNTVINDKNWTALHFAIKNKDEKLVKYLLLNSADPSLLTHKQRNCFHFAMQSSFKILKMLLFQISDLETNLQYETINASDIYGDTPLHILSRDMVKYKVNNFTIFDYMIKLGADPNLLNNEKISPIDILNEFPIGK
jgi:8-oxo-dGTP pyrophosphatase MutT (NUDIX family)